MRWWGGRTGRILAIGAVYTLIFLTVVHVYYSPAFDAVDGSRTPEVHVVAHNFKKERYHIQFKFGGGVATLFLKLQRLRDAVSVGEHVAQVVIHANCTYPRFAIRLFGDTLVPFELKQGFDDHKHIWNGKFVIPLEGTYTLDARWFGCELPNRTNTTWFRIPEFVELRAAGSQSGPSKRSKSELFSRGIWMAKSKLPFNQGADMPAPGYVWTTPDVISDNETSADSDLIEIQSKKLNLRTVLSKRGTLRPPNGMYRFNENGNYELVCFWGGQTVWELWQIFLLERRILSPGQRPFKFHYYNVSSLLHPTREWHLSEQKRSRKCKHIFFSVDEFEETLTHAAFEEQLSTFIMHLVKMLNDPTFPIWILTTTEPAMAATSCHQTALPRSTDHPCNDVIKGLFYPFQRFPSQVHLMDNTDLVLPRFGESRHDVLANIALRIFVAVGKGVADWRAMGQQGLIDGLHRNGTVEPNPELFPYEGWN